jgi:predicted dehydrogenase
MATKVLIVGLIRGGSWARDIHKVNDLEIAGLVDIDAANLARFGEELGVPPARRYTDFAQALQAEAEIVVIATPAVLHQEMSLAALRAGHHVICEKPVVVNMAAFRALRAALQGVERRFMVGEQYRFSDGVENLRQALAAGLIGRPAYIAHEFYRGFAQLAPRPGQPQDPHASLREMSIHHFDMWWYITGLRPVEICADPLNPPWNDSPRKFGYSIRATLEGGLPVHYLTCRALARPQTTWFGNLWIVGEEGALYWDGRGGAVTLSRTLPSHNAQEQHVASGPVSYAERAIPGIADGAVHMARALVEAIRTGRPHPCDIEDNLVSFATAMAAIESAQTGQPVKVVTA